MKIDGAWIVTDAQAFGGMVVGPITVEPTGSLELTGMCCSSVLVRGTAVISGMISGDLLVESGTVELRGMVAGSVFENGGEFKASPSAMIAGKRVKRTAL
ncbi:hypothetical protein [Cupriavidus sp. PET2-C1]